MASPAQYQVFQRSGTTGTITINGNVGGGTQDIEARWGGGGWTTIDSGATGTYSGTLTSQPQGQNTLEVRIVGQPESVIFVEYVGIGDIFLIMGQSNAAGQADQQQIVTPWTNSNMASLFGNDYLWKKMQDRTDSAVNQVDLVSDDSGALGQGSIWPNVAAGYILAHTGIPCAFVPCAKHSTDIASWLPGVSHTDRSTLYGSAVYRALEVGGVRMALWWQGESDALAGTSQATYSAHLNTIADALQADLGIKLMPAVLETQTGSSLANQAAINAAIIAGGTNIVTGPVLTPLTTNDAFHLTSPGNIAAASNLWIAAVNTAVP